MGPFRGAPPQDEDQDEDQDTPAQSPAVEAITRPPRARPPRRFTRATHHGATVLVIAIGGAIGALARFGLSSWLGSADHGFGVATLLENVSGCLVIGAFMTLITEVWSGHPLLRPFLGVGVLGGYTTFSTYVVETQEAIVAGNGRIALLYFVLTPLCALLAVGLGAALTAVVVRPGRKRKASR